jgi:F-box protein 18 (helicase)
MPFRARSSSFGATSGRAYTPPYRGNTPAAEPAQVTPEPTTTTTTGSTRVWQEGDEIPDMDDLPQTRPSATGAAPTIRKVGGLRISSEHELGLPVKKARVPVEYSAQQNAPIHSPAKIIVVNAKAGTGKTTMCVGYADARPQEKMLYVAFNKAIQEEAVNRFGSNVTAKTMHSLAWADFGRHYGDAKRLARPWRALVLKNEANITTFKDAAATQSILNSFFHSASTEIGPEHALEAELQYSLNDIEIHANVALARNVWRRMLDRRDTLSVPDDAYLKMWALSKPRLKFDRIIFDEAQDANPVIAEVIRAQTHAGLLYVGDPHQSIYGFRGATNAMSDFGDSAKKFDLSQTWRFGPKIAKVANDILREFKGEKVMIEGMGKDMPYVPGAPITVLSRTNAQLFKTAAQRQGKGVHWVGGCEKYQLGKLIDAYNLYMNKRDQIRDPFMRHFSSWAEMQAYAEEAKDPETRVLTEVIEEYRKETPNLVAAIRENEVKVQAQAEVVLSTSHGAKGLDFDFVELADDFKILKETEEDLANDPYAPINEQEINLLYVAVTRAKKMLQLDKETLAWIKDLPTHQEARARALRAVQSRDARRSETL